MANISFYGSHNAAFVIEENGEILLVAEVERLINQKNAGYCQYHNAQHRDKLIYQILEYIEQETGISTFDKCIWMNSDALEHKTKVRYQEIIPANEYIESLHHRSHAAAALYQSDYSEALILSFDGGGNDGWFNIYHAPNRKEINLLERRDDLDVGFPYMSFGQYMDEIKREPDLSLGNLVYPGKMMGLCSFGTVVHEWLGAFVEYFESKPHGLDYEEKLAILGEKIGHVFDADNPFKGELSHNIAATSQRAFETTVFKAIKPHLVAYPDIPLLIAGGCGLNIIFNTRLNKLLDREIFVPPNPNDCGLAAGMMLYELKPEKAIDLTYAGIRVLDHNYLMEIINERKALVIKSKSGKTRITPNSTQFCQMSEIARELAGGKIIGVVRDRSEHGPRALGNRSIICDPSIPGAKDDLNARVKGREAYRPFAPVVRLEDVNKFFEFDQESRWMTFCPPVREEYREVLAAVTHVDGTARVQTVTEEQNPWLYELLTEMDKLKGIGVLLNTSFNLAGKPILSTYKDALSNYDHTAMDGLILQDYYIYK